MPHRVQTVLPLEEMVADSAAQEAIEEQILKLPEITSSFGPSGEAPPVFNRFMDQIAPCVDLPRTTHYVLDAFSSRDVTSEKVAVALHGNVYLQQVFDRVIESLTKKKGEARALESAVVLLGMQNSRNLILAVQLVRTVHSTHPEWTADGKLKMNSKDFLKYALTLEESTVGIKEEYADLAFAAGYLFDLFVQIAAKQENSKKILTSIDATFKQGLKTAKIASEISKTIPEFGFRRHLFAAALVHEIGKVAMGILDPSYLEFQDVCAKKDLPREIRRYAEKKCFGMNHSVLGAVICYYSKIFTPMARALLYQHEPFLLSNREKKLYELAALVSLSTNIAQNFKKTDKLDDPVLERWKGPELAGYKIDMAKVMKAISTLS